jgi:hypothetical protein
MDRREERGQHLPDDDEREVDSGAVRVFLLHQLRFHNSICGERAIFAITRQPVAIMPSFILHLNLRDTAELVPEKSR